MSDEGKTDFGSLVPADRRGLMPISLTNPLIARGFKDIQRSSKKTETCPDFGNALIYFERGIKLLDKGEYDNAIKNFNEAIRFNANDAYFYINRGVAWSAKRDFDKAIKDYDQAIGLNPQDPRFYFIRGNAWF